MLSEQVRDNQMPRLVFPNEGRGIFTLSSPRVVSELMMVVNSTVSSAACIQWLLVESCSIALLW